MKRVLFFIVNIAVVSASELHFVSLPHSVRLTSANKDQELTPTQWNDLNNLLLGLSAKPVDGFEAEGDLFLRPRAIIIIMINGVESLNISEPHITYKLRSNRIDQSSWDAELASVFGPDREFVIVSHDGIKGCPIAQSAIYQKGRHNINTNLKILREELQHIHQLVDAIATRRANFSDQNVPAVYLVSITGLASQQLSNEERDVAIGDIMKTIYMVSDVLSEAFGGRVICEVATLGEANSNEPSQDLLPIRRKRDTDTSQTDLNLKLWRERLNVYVFVGTDYPAIFAIFAGLTIALVLAVLYAVVAMMSMDPSKDSIIYRMTTTRMKKA